MDFEVELLGYIQKRCRLDKVEMCVGAYSTRIERSLGEIEAILESIRDFIHGLGCDLEITVRRGYASKSPSIFYDRSSTSIIVRPLALLKDIIIYNEYTGLGLSDILFFMFAHEYGHYELHSLGVSSPHVEESYRFPILYSKFEDYAVSRILRGRLYREREQKILSCNAMMSVRMLQSEMLGKIFDWHLSYLTRTMITRNMESIATLGLTTALEYTSEVDLRELPEYIKLLILRIADQMRRINRETLHDLPDIAYRTWIESFIQ